MKAWAGDAPIDVLDMGCGTGFLALEFAALGHHATGADFSEQMIERARVKAAERSLEVRFDVADAENLPYPDGSFDLLIERHVVWTLHPTGGTHRVASRAPTRRAAHPHRRTVVQSRCTELTDACGLSGDPRDAPILWRRRGSRLEPRRQDREVLFDRHRATYGCDPVGRTSRSRSLRTPRNQELSGHLFGFP